jgi:hypothetical protein
LLSWPLQRGLDDFISRRLNKYMSDTKDMYMTASPSQEWIQTYVYYVLKPCRARKQCSVVTWCDTAFQDQRPPTGGCHTSKNAHPRTTLHTEVLFEIASLLFTCFTKASLSHILNNEHCCRNKQTTYTNIPPDRASLS